MTASSQMKEARRLLERQGFIATKTRGGHWRFEHPDMSGPVFAPDTPSDHRGLKNLFATLRRQMRSSIAQWSSRERGRPAMRRGGSLRQLNFRAEQLPAWRLQ